MRARVYPRLVQTLKMTQDEAQRELAAMEAIVATLTRLHVEACGSGQQALCGGHD